MSGRERDIDGDLLEEIRDCCGCPLFRHCPHCYTCLDCGSKVCKGAK